MNCGGATRQVRGEFEREVGKVNSKLAGRIACTKQLLKQEKTDLVEVALPVVFPVKLIGPISSGITLNIAAVFLTRIQKQSTFLGYPLSPFRYRQSQLGKMWRGAAVLFPPL
jgi:hypothetical protein